MLIASGMVSLLTTLMTSLHGDHMTNTIKVEIKTIYGNQKIYPACDKAEGFCKLINQKTLTERDIKLIKELGYEVQVQPSHPATL